MDGFIVAVEASPRGQPTQGLESQGVLPFSLSSAENKGLYASGTDMRSIRISTTDLASEKDGVSPSVWESTRAIILSSYLNVFLIFVPISWALGFGLPERHTTIFACSFLAIIPLAQLLSFATEELSLHVGQTVAGLMNATLGNAVELVVSIIALTKCELNIVQSSLMGSVLSNILLVLGACFFAGGLKFSEQGFGTSAAQLNSSLLTISVIAISLPAALFMALQALPNFNRDDAGQHVLGISHGIAIIMLLIYLAYLYFQLSSHTELFEDDSGEISVSKKYTGGNPFTRRFKSIPCWRKQSLTSLSTARYQQIQPQENEDGDIALTEDVGRNSIGISVDESQNEVNEEQKPQMTVTISFVLLTAVTLLTSITADFLVDSIDGMTRSTGISKEFVGVILLPIVGNAADHTTAVTVSVKDKLTLSMGVSVGSSIQIALFVIPFSVILGWILGKPLTLLFDPLETVVMFLAVLTVNYAIRNGKSNWLQGMILMSLYCFVCITFWYYPGSPRDFLTCA